ncbi:MAG TPA: hypothetical protein VFB33_09425 [Candidatus Binataceae bacterium]|jgi:hypothetical protein|nr:hypothetical protein [Candidatus Binataceae bacterium]
METLAAVLSLTSGFALMRYRGGPAEMIATSLLIDAALAPLTATIASRRGRSPWVWAPLGFALGMWALAAALLMRPPRAGGAPRPTAPPPPTSDAA